MGVEGGDGGVERTCERVLTSQRREDRDCSKSEMINAPMGIDSSGVLRGKEAFLRARGRKKK